MHPTKETGKNPELPKGLGNILIDKENYKKLPKELKKIQSYILEKV